MNIRSLTTTKEQTRGPESQTPRELAQNVAEASTHILAALLILIIFAIYLLRTGNNVHRVQPIPQVFLFGIIAIIAVRRLAYGIELYRLNTLSKNDFKQDILSRITSVVQDVLDHDDELEEEEIPKNRIVF